MISTLCSGFPVIGLTAYGLVGLAINSNLSNYGKAGPPTGIDAWKRSSYSKNGQMWWKFLMVWIFLLPVFILITIAAMSAVCP
jgi:hypothetical protein